MTRRSRAGPQLDLFAAEPALPEGLRIAQDVVTPHEEAELVAHLEMLPFEHFDFHGHRGNRRVVSFGRRYDFASERLREADEMPAVLLPLRDRAAAFAGLAAERLGHVLITEYAPGAGIGWHKDKAVFAEVIGVSLLAPCTFRLRRGAGAAWERASFVATPRSAYLLTGPARTEWEHSIPPVDRLRYSVTFRTLR